MEQLSDPEVQAAVLKLVEVMSEGKSLSNGNGKTKVNGKTKAKTNGSKKVSTFRRPGAALAKAAPITDWPSLRESLTPTTKNFLTYIEDVKEATVEDIAVVLGIPHKGVGGMIGSLTRKANKFNLAIPLTARDNQFGVKTWVWSALT